MRLQTDDDIFRTDFVWLGYVEMPWPFQATYRAWGVFLATLTLLVSALGVATLLHLPLIGFGPRNLWFAFLAAIFFAYWFGSRVDHDRPVATTLKTMARRQFRTPKPAPVNQRVIVPQMRKMKVDRG